MNEQSPSMHESVQEHVTQESIDIDETERKAAKIAREQMDEAVAEIEADEESPNNVLGTIDLDNIETDSDTAVIQPPESSENIDTNNPNKDEGQSKS